MHVAHPEQEQENRHREQAHAQKEHQEAEHDEKKEMEQAEQRSSPGGKVVYHAILKEADEELDRSSSALFWSGLAAGLSMGFSLITEALIRRHLPDATWVPLIAKIGYSVGFMVVILGRQQLFTENTLTPMLPLMKRKDAQTVANVARLWGVVLLANLIGAFVVAYVIARSTALDEETRGAVASIGHETMRHGFGTTMLSAVFAGWLIALLVWMLPYAESAHFFVIVLITWVIGIGHFAHVVAGAVNVFALAWAGQKGWENVFSDFIIPALLGNILGGVMLVAGLNHAQVVSGEEG